jgi:hypothetical protein
MFAASPTHPLEVPVLVIVLTAALVLLVGAIWLLAGAGVLQRRGCAAWH